MPQEKIALKTRSQLAAIRKDLDRLKSQAIEVSDAIWQFAEPSMQEFKSADRLEQFLSEHGFSVTRPWADAPTAFLAVAGKGKPRVALMSEYDALPNCGDKPGQWGHGCGHNLLGTASALAGILAAQALQRTKTPGQVVVIGTPGEEILRGKVILAELGAFEGLDAVIAWHPDSRTGVKHYGGQAMDSLTYRFFGTTAHAAAAPQMGRSALDAAILTDVAINYLREHIEENARIHCVIPEGGKAPNVVPDRAELWYYVRARDRQQVDELTRRMTLCAKGAAMATETRVKTLFHDSITERIPNWPMSNMLQAAVDLCGSPAFTTGDQKQADQAVPANTGYTREIVPIPAGQERASSDESNVSWFAPMGRLNVACGPGNVKAHNHENAAIVGTSGAHRGLLKAAEIMAMSAVELAGNKQLLTEAKAEWQREMKGKVYKLPPRADGVRRRTARKKK